MDSVAETWTRCPVHPLSCRLHPAPGWIGRWPRCQQTRLPPTPLQPSRFGAARSEPRQTRNCCAKMNHRRCTVEVQPSKTHGSLEPQITKASWFSKCLRLCVCKRRVPQGTLPKEGRVGVKSRLLNTAPSTFTYPGNCRAPKDGVSWQCGRCRRLSQLCSDTGGRQGPPCYHTPSPAPPRVSAHQGQKGISHSPATSCSHSPSAGNGNLGNIPLSADFTFQNTSILCSLFSRRACKNPRALFCPR